MSEPAYTRLRPDERRAQLLALGADLFTRHAYADLTMAKIAVEAGITKPLLYHYFPSKEAYFEEVLTAGVEDLANVTAPDPELPPLEALSGSVDAWLAWIAGNRGTYEAVLRNAPALPAVGAMLTTLRHATADRILDGVAADRREDPKLRMAVRAWLWLMDGAIHDWLAHGDVERDAVRDYLLGALAGSIAAAG